MDSPFERAIKGITYTKTIVKTKRKIVCKYFLKQPGVFYIVKRNDDLIGPFMIQDPRFEALEQ